MWRKLTLSGGSHLDEDTILFDNGSTHTMTWNIDDLENTEPVEAKVMLPRGSTLEVTGDWGSQDHDPEARTENPTAN